MNEIARQIESAVHYATKTAPAELHALVEAANNDPSPLARSVLADYLDENPHFAMHEGVAPALRQGVFGDEEPHHYHVELHPGGEGFHPHVGPPQPFFHRLAREAGVTMHKLNQWWRVRGRLSGRQQQELSQHRHDVADVRNYLVRRHGEQSFSADARQHQRMLDRVTAIRSMYGDPPEDDIEVRRAGE